MSRQIIDAPNAFIQGTKLTNEQLSQEIATMTNLSLSGKLSIAYQDDSLNKSISLRIDAINHVIESDSHLPESIIVALHHLFGDNMTLHVISKDNNPIFHQSNRNLLFKDANTTSLGNQVENSEKNNAPSTFSRNLRK